MANFEALMDGFLCKAAITNDYIMKRLVGVKKQLGDMGAVTRRHFSPELKTVATGGGGAKDYILRPGSGRELAKHLSMLEGGAHGKRQVSLLSSAVGKPRKGLLPEKQRLQNLLDMHHEKTELQAKRRFGYDLTKPDERRHASHLHPSVIERESMMTKRFGTDSHPKELYHLRKFERPPVYTKEPTMIEESIARLEKEQPEVALELKRQFPGWKRGPLDERWSKAYDYYRNLRA